MPDVFLGGKLHKKIQDVSDEYLAELLELAKRERVHFLEHVGATTHPENLRLVNERLKVVRDVLTQRNLSKIGHSK